jgi:hypothetical protein
MGHLYGDPYINQPSSLYVVYKSRREMQGGAAVAGAADLEYGCGEDGEGRGQGRCDRG